MKKYIYIAVFIMVTGLGGLFAFIYFKEDKKIVSSPKQSQEKEKSETNISPESKKEVYEPLDKSGERITKKPFGIYITPQNSPVKPEKFTGFHTGTDFEASQDELNKEILVHAICAGEILEKKFVSGYGGVLIQSCTMQGQVVRVLYGHLDIASSQIEVGQEISGSTRIAVLAPANSYYSGGERKHLHLGIHRGEQTDYRGYVNNKSELSQWVDFKEYRI